MLCVGHFHDDAIAVCQFQMHAVMVAAIDEFLHERVHDIRIAFAARGIGRC